MRISLGGAALAALVLWGPAALADAASMAACRVGEHEHEGDPSELGSPFALIGDTGEVVTSVDLFDRPSLVYFGYTFCPDICPFDAARNAQAVDRLSERGIAVRPVFVTVDPGRDTPEVLADYTASMHPEMVGLTGSPEQISAVADAYGVLYTTPPEGDNDPFYLVGHSTFTYLVLPESGVVDRISRSLGAEDMADRVACILQAE